MQPTKMTVSQFANYVSELVSTAPVFVEGEVSNYRDIPGRKFSYFDIKDNAAVAKCFQGFWNCPKVDLENGSLIRVYGVPTLQKNGSLVIDVRQVQLVGEGALMQAYLKLKESLKKEGVFNEAHKKELPMFPEKVGLIAGKNSSAYHDVAAEVMERWSGSKLLFHSSKVQGIYAKKEVIAAIQYFNRQEPVDVLIIARGGGSLEDLQAFDSEEVVREIFASKIPIISAIGHEDHWTLSDFVSDMRAKTPTKAAQLAVPSEEEIKDVLDRNLKRIGIVTSQRIEETSVRLNYIEQEMGKTQISRVDLAREKCEETFNRVSNLMNITFDDLQSKLDNIHRSLNLINPQNVLKRGFAVVEKKGKRIKSLGDISIGDEIITTLQDGYFEGTIKNKIRNKKNDFNEKLKKR